jgi:radical SAM protein with 4Fe4S-binding SPASM domain
MNIKKILSPEYNMLFNPEDGMLVRWGKTFDDDPKMCPMGPELFDIEISTVCHGIGKSMSNRQPCSFCYKTNTASGENMSFETFEKVFSKLPKSTTQIAFGIGDIDGNPDMWKIMEHCRNNCVVPNLTTNGMGVSGEIAERLAKTCGAVAVSHYGIDDVCFNAVDAMTKAGLKQCNLHKLLSAETYDSCFELIDKVSKHSQKHDTRLSNIKAIVFLLLKPKGGRNRYNPIVDVSKYRTLVEYAQARNVSIGMDSCSAPMALKTLPRDCISSIEPCEAFAFSAYVNVKGQLFPCSFTEGTHGWETGIDMLSVKDFVDDVWFNTRVSAFRERLFSSSNSCTSCDVSQHCRSCVVYPDITLCKEEQFVQIGKRI